MFLYRQLNDVSMPKVVYIRREVVVRKGFRDISGWGRYWEKGGGQGKRKRGWQTI
jgi:hypothetical protein